ncbi:MAG: hypothetical protein QNJ92_11545 [Alphaproteobacteria bacterium]|nr:hypothetical protein [Alphaproteobacteria bacterium]
MRTLRHLGVALLLTASATAQAEPANFTTVVTPVHEGYAISIDLPDSADWKWSSGPGEISATWLGETTHPVKDEISHPRVGLNIYLRRRPIAFDQFVEDTIDGWKNFAMIVHEHGVDDAFGQPTFFYTNSDEECYVDGKTVACAEPHRMMYKTVLHGRVQTEFYLHTTHPEDFERLKPVFQEIASTVKVIPESELDPAQTSTYYESPAVNVSQRRSYFLESHFTILLPPGWIAEEAEIRSATDENERGRIVLVFYEDTPTDPSDHYEALFVVVEGLPFSALSRSDYLATAPGYISAFLEEHTEIAMPGSVALPAQQSSPDGFCLSKVRTRHSRGTGDLQVKTFAGTDEDGRSLKLRIYTGGGMTQACNIIYVADPEIFDDAQDRVDAMVRSLNLIEIGPSLGLR